MVTELYARGPIACTINCEPLHKYTGGIFNDTAASKESNHIISITGFGVEDDGTKYWVRMLLLPFVSHVDTS